MAQGYSKYSKNTKIYKSKSFKQINLIILNFKNIKLLLKENIYDYQTFEIEFDNFH